MDASLCGVILGIPPLYLGAQPTQGSHLTLLLTATLPAVSLSPKCLITVNTLFPVPTATS